MKSKSPGVSGGGGQDEVMALSDLPEEVLEEFVVTLMESSKTRAEWSQNCKLVKAAFGGHYPPFWYAAILKSGLVDSVIKVAGDPQGASFCERKLRL